MGAFFVARGHSYERKGGHVDLTPFIGPSVTMLVFLIGGYITVKTTNNNRFSRIESEMSAINTRLQHVEEQTKITSEIITSLAELKTEMRTLRTSVEKHNGVVERTVVLERDQKTLWKRQDELRDELHEFQHEQREQLAHASDNK